MATALKDIYSKEFYHAFLKTIRQVVPEVDEKRFLASVFTSDWEKLELKDRMSHTARVLNKILASDYKLAVEQIVEIINVQQSDKTNGFNFEFMFFPDYVQQFGLNDYETSISAIERITQYTSCEFVVRHFLMKYPEKMVQQMQDWAQHPHHYVRRLASEGMRTRLPWAISVPLLKQNPDLILPILQTLINDESEWVRRSVANSLNDLSKDYPELSLSFTQKWIGHSTEVDKALKHGARGLLKKGNPEMLGYFGLDSGISINVETFSLEKQHIKVGEYLSFDLNVLHREKHEKFLRIEYRVYFLRSNGTHHAKTFKITEKKLAPNEQIQLSKKHSFKPISTRTYYPGEQHISLLVNGQESEKLAFYLKG